MAVLGAAHAQTIAPAPAFGAVMSQQDLRDVAAYLVEDLLRA